MSKSLALISGLAIALAPAMAFGHVIDIPAWRGAAESTYQEWSFSTNANPSAPDSIDNDFGTASASMVVGEFGTGWLDSLPGLGEQTGYWDLGTAGTMVLDIDNTTVAADHKLIWVQVTYFRDINQGPVVDIPGAQFVDSQTTQYQAVPTGGEWLIEKSIWQMPMGSGHEQVVILSDMMFGSVIDHVVVDTIAVPEPASVLGLLLGGAILIVRKRR